MTESNGWALRTDVLSSDGVDGNQSDQSDQSDQTNQTQISDKLQASKGLFSSSRDGTVDKDQPKIEGRSWSSSDE